MTVEDSLYVLRLLMEQNRTDHSTDHFGREPPVLLMIGVYLLMPYSGKKINQSRHSEKPFCLSN